MTVLARLAWVDNLKIAVISGVIVAHAATAYILDIDWYYDIERTTSPLWEPLLGLPVLLGAVFGLGPLFLLGGVFAASSLARKGSGRFVHSRLLRLGVPLVLFVALIDPLTDYLSDLPEGMASRPWPYLAPGSEVRDAGPLWFVAALLTFSLVYAAWRWRRPATGNGGGALVLPAEGGRLRRPPAGPALKWWSASAAGIWLFTVEGVVAGWMVAGASVPG